MSSLSHLLYQNVADKMALTHVIAAVVEADTQSQTASKCCASWRFSSWEMTSSRGDIA